MKRALTGMLAALSVLIALGCAGTAGPNWFHPGPAGYQQAMAVQYDPYPENEPGPKIVGARPPGYEKPIPEVERARWFQPCQAFRASWLPWNWGR
jgi:hypothetical protein